MSKRSNPILVHLSAVRHHRTVWVGRYFQDHLVPTSTMDTRPGCSGPHPICPWALSGMRYPQLLQTTLANASLCSKHPFLTSNLDISFFSSNPFPITICPYKKSLFFCKLPLNTGRLQWGLPKSLLFSMSKSPSSLSLLSISVLSLNRPHWVGLQQSSQAEPLKRHDIRLQ